MAAKEQVAELKQRLAELKAQEREIYAEVSSVLKDAKTAGLQVRTGMHLEGTRILRKEMQSKCLLVFCQFSTIYLRHRTFGGCVTSAYIRVSVRTAEAHLRCCRHLDCNPSQLALHGSLSCAAQNLAHSVRSPG